MEKEEAQRIKEADVEYVWHHFCSPRTYAQRPLVIKKAEGCKLYDVDGKEYVDAVSGITAVNVGYGNKKINEAMKRQIDQLSFSTVIYASSPVTALAAKKVASITPAGLEKVWFVSGGSEAVESAIKIARQFHYLRGDRERYRVVSRWMSYHGATLGALSCTGHPIRREVFEPLLLKFPHIVPCYCYRCPFGKEYPGCDLDCARALEYAIKVEGAKSISAFIAEPVVGLTGAGITPPREYYKIIREVCDRYTILFIADEVLTGFGRTGEMFAIEHYGVKPDIMVVGKGITSGYVPLGAAIAKREVEEEFEKTNRIFQHGHTFGGHPLACAACVANIDVIVSERLVEKGRETSRYLMKRLFELNHEIIGDIRGKGLLVGVELVRDKKTKKIFRDEENVGSKIAQLALEQGVVIFGTKAFDLSVMSDILYLSPPLTVRKEEIDKIVDVVDKSIGEVERSML